MRIINPGKYIEKGVDWISTNAAPFLDGVSNVIEFFVEGFQDLLLFLHPFLMIVVLALLIYVANAGGFKTSLKKKGWRKGRGMLVFSLVGLFFLFAMGFWVETMQTLALVISSSFIALLFGIPIGIWSARNDSAERIIRPVLDFMQTMPAFVYLIPAILFFSVGNVPGVIATVIFSLPPAVRLTNLGIRNVPSDVVEAAKAFGSTPSQLLFKVQFPLALPTILAGVNQVIMLALSMVVIASMVGASGLGEKVYQGILQADIGLGFEAGLGIVIVAIILDRVSQAFGVVRKK